MKTVDPLGVAGTYIGQKETVTLPTLFVLLTELARLDKEWYFSISF